MSTWEAIPLGKAGSWLSGGTPSKQQLELWSGPVPWVSPKDMKQSRLQDAIDHVSFDALDNGTQLAPQASLLMVVRGMILAHTFPVALALRPLAFNQDIKALVPSDRFKSEFLLYWLQAKSPEVLRLVDVANHGTKRLPSERLFALEVLAPPPWEQNKIAAILSSVDDAIQTTQAVIDQLGVVKKALMAELLTRGIPGRHTKFKQTEIGEVPEEWAVGQIGNFFQLQRGFDITEKQVIPGEIPVVSSGGVSYFHSIAKCPSPGVVTGRKGKLGEVFFLDRPFWPHDTTLWVSQFGGNDPQFVAWFLRYLNLARFDFATAVPTLNRNNVHPLLAAFPSLEEQIEIQAALGSIVKTIEDNSAELWALRQVKSCLMSALLSGDLRVTPDEHPA